MELRVSSVFRSRQVNQVELAIVYRKELVVFDSDLADCMGPAGSVVLESSCGSSVGSSDLVEHQEIFWGKDCHLFGSIDFDFSEFVLAYHYPVLEL